MTQIPYDCNYLRSVSRLLDKFLLKSHYSNLCKAVSDIIYPSRKLLTVVTLLQPHEVGAKTPVVICELSPHHSAPTAIKSWGGRHKAVPSRRGWCRDKLPAQRLRHDPAPRVRQSAWLRPMIPPQLHPPLRVSQGSVFPQRHSFPPGTRWTWKVAGCAHFMET